MLIHLFLLLPYVAYKKHILFRKKDIPFKNDEGELAHPFPIRQSFVYGKWDIVCSGLYLKVLLRKEVNNFSYSYKCTTN